LNKFTRRSSRGYWLARIAAGNANTTLDSLFVDSDGTVTMRATQTPG
jgi:hypothetical protein